MNNSTSFFNSLYASARQLSHDELISRILLTVITIGCICWLIYLIIDDGMTCRRISQSVNEIISSTDQSEDDKATNLWWICGNCAMFASRSLFFKSRYHNIIANAQNYILSPKRVDR